MPFNPSSLPRDFGTSCRITAMTIRLDESGTTHLDATVIPAAGAPVRVSFARPYPAEDAVELFFAERLSVENEGMTQREYGTFHVEFWVEGAYHEFWADSYSEAVGA